MNPKPSASEECFFKRLREQPVELHVAVPGAFEPGERARSVHHGSVVSTGRAWQTRMLNGKVGYYADFVIYGMLVVALVAFALGKSRSDQVVWLAAATACLCWHADVGKCANSGRSILYPHLVPDFVQCRVRSNQRAHHRLALVRDCASCHPLPPPAPTGNRPEGTDTPTSSSSFPSCIWEFRCDDCSMGLRVWYSHLIWRATDECCRTTTGVECHPMTWECLKSCIHSC